MRTLGWFAAAALLAVGCTAVPDEARRSALLDDARRCEAEADEQLRNMGQHDTTIRILFFRSCMALRGWEGR